VTTISELQTNKYKRKRQCYYQLSSVEENEKSTVHAVCPVMF